MIHALRPTSRLTVPKGSDPTGQSLLQFGGQRDLQILPDDRFIVDPDFKIENLKLFETEDRKRSA